MKKRLTNVQKLVIAFVVCAIMIGSSFLGVSFTIGKSTEKLLKENKTLQEEYDNLLTYIQNKGRYTIESEKYELGAKKIVNKYPNNARITSLTYEFERWWDGVGDSSYENQYDLMTPSIEFSKDVDEVATIYIGEDTYIWNKSTFSISYNTKYGNFKNYMNDLYELQYGICPTAITISTDTKDDETTLVGSINFDINFVNGSENEDLVEPTIDNSVGVDSLFVGSKPTQVENEENTTQAEGIAE